MKQINLKEKYNQEVILKMKEKFNYKNDLAVPRLKKIVINVSAGRLSQQASFEDKILPEIIKNLVIIFGQKPITTVAKKSIAGFKTREGQIVGLKITLRRRRMYDFLERLVRIVLPRVKDFKGIELKNIDQSGNLNIGIREQAVFPEIISEMLKVDFGLEISIVNNAKSRDEAIELYRQLGLPLKK